MTASPPFDLFGLGKRLLGLVVAELTDAGIKLPSTQYFAPGQSVAYDGEQVTVSVLNIRPGQVTTQSPYEPPGFMQQASGLAIAIVRNTPVGSDDGTPPPVEAMEAAAQVNAKDVAALFDALVAIRDAGTWVDQATPWAITEVRTEGPQGGVVAAVGMIAVQLV